MGPKRPKPPLSKHTHTHTLTDRHIHTLTDTHTHTHTHRLTSVDRGKSVSDLIKYLASGGQISQIGMRVIVEIALLAFLTHVRAHTHTHTHTRTRTHMHTHAHAHTPHNTLKNFHRTGVQILCNSIRSYLRESNQINADLRVLYMTMVTQPADRLKTKWSWSNNGAQ